MKAALSPQVEPVADSRAWRVLGSSTFAFTICFAVWMMFAILGIPLKKQLHLTDTEFGLIAAMPVLTGSLARVPLGIWTDRFGGRIVFFITMLATVVPIWLVSYATQLWQFLALGLFVGGGPAHRSRSARPMSRAGFRSRARGSPWASSTRAIRAPRASADTLTALERDIVRELARGASNKAIARTLDRAESTVKIHVRNILRKLGLTSRVQVAIYAIGHDGMADEPDEPGEPRGR